MLKLLMVLGMVGLGAHYWSEHRTAASPRPAGAVAAAGGFVDAAMPDGARPGAVLILAPENCPSDDARRADDLAESLQRMGIPIARSSHYSSRVENPSAEQKADVERAVAVLNGAIPAVFVNGKAKSNPTADEVAAVFRQTR